MNKTCIMLGALVAFQLAAEPVIYEFNGGGPNGDVDIAVTFDLDDPSIQTFSEMHYSIPNGSVEISYGDSSYSYDGIELQFYGGYEWSSIEVRHYSEQDYFHLMAGAQDVALLNAVPTNFNPVSTGLENGNIYSDEPDLNNPFYPHLPLTFTASYAAQDPEQTPGPDPVTSSLVLSGVNSYEESIEIHVVYEPQTEGNAIIENGGTVEYILPEAAVTASKNGLSMTLNGVVVSLNDSSDTFSLYSETENGYIDVYGYAAALDGMDLLSPAEVDSVINHAQINASQFGSPYFYIQDGLYSQPHLSEAPTISLVTGSGCQVTDQVSYEFWGRNVYGEFTATVTFDQVDMVDTSNLNPRFNYEIPNASVHVINGPYSFESVGVRFNFQEFGAGAAALSIETIQDPNDVINQFDIDTFAHYQTHLDPTDENDDMTGADTFFNVYANSIGWYDRSFLSGSTVTKTVVPSTCN